MTLRQEIALAIAIFVVVMIVRTYAPLKEEAVSAEAGGGAVAAAVARGFDPSRPPQAMRDECAREGKQLYAWRSDGELAWSYDCLRVGGAR